MILPTITEMHPLHKKNVPLLSKSAKMGIPRFFKINEPNRFNYTPLYWDPEKEEFEERVRRIKAELGQEVTYNKGSSTITRGSFRQYYSKNKQKTGRESNLRLVIIAAVLILLSYLLFYR